MALCWTIQYLCVSLLLRSPELDRGLKEWPHQLWEKGRITLKEFLAILCWMHPGYHWTSFQQGHHNATCSIGHPFNQTELFLQSCFSPLWLLVYIFTFEDVPPCTRFLLNSMTFPSSGFSSLLSSLWMRAWIFGVSATFLSFVSIENLPRFPLLRHLYQ